MLNFNSLICFYIYNILFILFYLGRKVCAESANESSKGAKRAYLKILLKLGTFGTFKVRTFVRTFFRPPLFKFNLQIKSAKQLKK